MTAEQMLNSLRPLLAQRRTADALDELDGFIAAVERFRDNPAITVVEMARLRQARVRIAAGKPIGTS